MPASITLPLCSAASVTNVLRYIYDGDRESHQEYAIERDDAGPPEPFVHTIEDLLVRLNREMPPSHHVSTRAQWVIVRFADGTDLDERERKFVLRTLQSGIDAQKARWAWHRNLLNLSADLNLVMPSLTGGILPRLRRWITQSLWTTVKVLMDPTVIAMNAERSCTGRAPMAEMQKIQQSAMRTPDGRPLVEALATAAFQMKLSLGVTNLPVLLSAVGYKHDDWEIQDDAVYIRRGRKRAKQKLDDILAAALLVRVTLGKGSARLQETAESRQCDEIGLS